MLGSDIQYKNVFNNVFGDLCIFDVISLIVYVKLNIFIIIHLAKPLLSLFSKPFSWLSLRC